MDEATRLATVIGGVYDASLDPALWSTVLGEVRDFVGGSAAGIVAKDAAANRGAVCFDDGGFEPDYTELYFERYVTLDPCTTGHFFSTVDNPVSTVDLIPRDAFLETRFYKEWAKPQGFVDYIAAAIDKSMTTAVVFNVIRRHHDGMFDEAAKHRVRLIAPHIRRSVLIGRTIDLKAAETTSLADAFDGLAAAMFLVEGNGRIVHANAAGHAIVRGGDFLHAANGRLVARHAETNQLLRNALTAAENGDAALGTKGIGLLFTTRDGESYVAHVLSLKSGARRRAGSAYAAAAAIFVHKAALEVSSPPETIARHYRLTPAELRVLLAIVEVGGVPEVAEVLGVADTTVKTHLGNLYGKTGTSRQADLVKLVAGFASPLIN